MYISHMNVISSTFKLLQMLNEPVPKSLSSENDKHFITLWSTGENIHINIHTHSFTLYGHVQVKLSQKPTFICRSHQNVQSIAEVIYIMLHISLIQFKHTTITFTILNNQVKHEHVHSHYKPPYIIQRIFIFI